MHNQTEYLSTLELDRSHLCCGESSLHAVLLDHLFSWLWGKARLESGLSDIIVDLASNQTGADLEVISVRAGSRSIRIYLD